MCFIVRINNIFLLKFGYFLHSSLTYVYLSLSLLSYFNIFLGIRNKNLGKKLIALMVNYMNVMSTLKVVNQRLPIWNLSLLSHVKGLIIIEYKETSCMMSGSTFFFWSYTSVVLSIIVQTPKSVLVIWNIIGLYGAKRMDWLLKLISWKQKLRRLKRALITQFLEWVIHFFKTSFSIAFRNSIVYICLKACNSTSVLV